MKTIKNLSLQGFEVYLATRNGPKPIWLAPSSCVVVPESFISEQVKLLVKRRILKVY